MKSLIVIGLFGLALSTAACSGSSQSSDTGISSADRLVVDVRCASNADCPASFECELEHGASASFCKSHDAIGGPSSPSCPAGTEAEAEHGTTFCKAHGGTASDGGEERGGMGGGRDDDASASTSGGAAAGATCATSADCAAGLECEIEVEHGVTTSICKAHRGSK